ncbi:MAG: phosphotransferase enzyme family protein, partial [Candidatus Adiutrix sp.]
MAAVTNKQTPMALKAEQVAQQCFGLKTHSINYLSSGHVNETFLIKTHKGPFILQRLNEFFNASPALGFNWLAVQRAAAERFPPPAPMPIIQPDLQGNLLTFFPNDLGTWRLTTYIAASPGPKTVFAAKEAAVLLGSFHTVLNTPTPLALEPLPDGEFTNQHLCRSGAFEELLVFYKGHPHLDALSTLIDEAAIACDELPHYPGFIDIFNHHDVVIHGDPKADNFLFQGRHAAAMVDWDTVSYGHVLIDVAEMLRSWGTILFGGRMGFDLEMAKAIVAGYAETGLPLADDDIKLLPPLLRAIALNLCRRYLTDALAESYFKWDKMAYQSLYEQNRTKAALMLDLAGHILDREIELDDTLTCAYKTSLNDHL